MIEIDLPAGIDSIQWMDGFRFIWGEDPDYMVQPEEAQRQLRSIYALGAGKWDEQLETIHLGTTMFGKVKSGLSDTLRNNFTDDLVSGKGKRRGHALTFTIEYDPAEWFEGETEFYDHASGRLFWLAKSGVLQAAGLEVTGTDL